MANVLKSDSSMEKAAAARELSGLAGFNLSDLADEGRARLEQCRQQVQQMLQDARHQAEQLRQQAEQRGYEEGSARAEAEFQQKLQEQAEIRARDGLHLIQQAVTQLHATYESWMQQYAQSLCHIAIASAERIVMRRLQQEPQLLVKWTKEALGMMRASTSVTVAVHPETLAQLGDALDQLLTSSDLPEQTQIEPDESVGKDSVVVRQEGGDIEAGLQTQLQRLEELLS